mgnify:CR=1 FL=1
MTSKDVDDYAKLIISAVKIIKTDEDKKELLDHIENLLAHLINKRTEELRMHVLMAMKEGLISQNEDPGSVDDTFASGIDFAIRTFRTCMEPNSYVDGKSQNSK